MKYRENSGMQTGHTKKMIFIGMFAAVLSTLSQLQIPMPNGVPVTLQTFAVALTGCFLGWKSGVITVMLYLLLGTAGLPVFSGFGGGIGKIAGPTGGFLFGFLFLAGFCGLAGERRGIRRVALETAGLILCHGVGVLQYSSVMACGYLEAFLISSAPYLLKDMVSIIGAVSTAELIRRRLRTAGLPVQ